MSTGIDTSAVSAVDITLTCQRLASGMKVIALLLFHYSHCWEIMAQSALRKYPNPHNPNVYSLDVLQRRIRRKEITMCRLFSTLWNVPAIVLQVSVRGYSSSV